MKPQIYIGIDAGVNTGFALYKIKSGLLIVESLPIHQAMLSVLHLFINYDNIKVIVEDARLRKWYGNDKGDQAQRLMLKCILMMLH